MSICIASAITTLLLAGEAFTLSWTHSVEKVGWQEHWRVDGARLVIDEARVKGSGAGMEPPDDAVLRSDGWWVYRPGLPPQQQLLLAVSGATPDGWLLCVDGGSCHQLEQVLPPGPDADGLRISPGPGCEKLGPAPAGTVKSPA